MEEKSKKQKVFILHGWTYSVERWDLILDLFKQKGIDVELLKIPGLTAPLKGVWELYDYVKWLKQKTQRTHEKVVLIGHSNGGRIAAAFSALHPEKVSSLVLIDSAGIIRHDVKTVLKKTIFSFVAKTGSKITKSAKARDFLYKVIGESDYNKANETVKQTMINLISKDLTESFSTIIIPTLIIWGEKDRVTPLSDGQKINTLIKGSELVVVQDAHHSPHFTNPEFVFQKITSFIKNYGHF